MGHAVEAKLRILRIIEDYNDQVILELAPVCPSFAPEGREAEVRSFWEATPSGEMQITLQGIARARGAYPKPGQYLTATFIFDEACPLDWQVWSARRIYNQLDVELQASKWAADSETGVCGGAQRSFAKLTITNEATWPLFELHRRMRVELTPAFEGEDH